ncbi:uncharacterized protein LOC126903021 isoform X2 [Daktulosphaira vitifoliae]|uniref:uncharacterized protein LOC126903021 isoform X2 n=1 Tax=Daktulosphaira vitifoliae TaxID=58002 RepID=UPI0021AA4983|nr:uncharacterized protein LOC126903021 isoform X2 [Daktulosphaira vitifoliae]
MKSLGVCFFLVVCHLIILHVKESVQDRSERDSSVLANDMTNYFRTPIHNQPEHVRTYDDDEKDEIPKLANGRIKVAVINGGKRGNQFKKEIQTKKESYIPIKAYGKRGGESYLPVILGLYSDSGYIDPFQKWLVSMPYYH